MSYNTIPVIPPRVTDPAAKRLRNAIENENKAWREYLQCQQELFDLMRRLIERNNKQVTPIPPQPDTLPEFKFEPATERPKFTHMLADIASSTMLSQPAPVYQTNPIMPVVPKPPVAPTKHQQTPVIQRIQPAPIPRIQPAPIPRIQPASVMPIPRIQPQPAPIVPQMQQVTPIVPTQRQPAPVMPEF